MGNNGTYETRPAKDAEGPTLASLDDVQQAAPTLYDLLAPFTGNQYRFLLAFLRDPAAQYVDLCDAVGIAHQTLWSWRSTFPNFRIAMDAIKTAKVELRLEYAKLAFLNAIPKVADAMIERAQGNTRDAQRAGERLLEATGALPKAGDQALQAPIQVVTHTYVLVGRDTPRQVEGVVVEGEAKALPPKAEP